jgi:hypothetical protein
VLAVGVIVLGEGIVVLEYGYSNVPGGFGGEDIDGSYAMVLENTGGDLAERVQVIVTVKDDDGVVLDSETHEVYFIRGGEQAAIGKSLGGIRSLNAPIAEIDIQWGGTGDLFNQPLSGGIETDNVNTFMSGGTTEVTFNAESDYDEEIGFPYTTAVLRNGSSRRPSVRRISSSTCVSRINCSARSPNSLPDSSPSDTRTWPSW